jgi:hypothetical protein
MSAYIVGQDEKRMPHHAIEEFIARYQARDNTQRNDREALLALITVVNGLALKMLKDEGIELKDPNEVQEVTPEEEVEPVAEVAGDAG